MINNIIWYALDFSLKSLFSSPFELHRLKKRNVKTTRSIRFHCRLYVENKTLVRRNIHSVRYSLHIQSLLTFLILVLHTNVVIFSIEDFSHSIFFMANLQFGDEIHNTVDEGWVMLKCKLFRVYSYCFDFKWLITRYVDVDLGELQESLSGQFQEKRQRDVLSSISSSNHKAERLFTQNGNVKRLITQFN